MSAARSTLRTSRRSASRGLSPIKAPGSFGTYVASPVVVNGVMYTQDIQSNVEAINVDSGKVLWTHNYNSASVGPNGVTVGNGVVYGGDRGRGLRSAGLDGQSAVDQEADPQRQRGHRHGPGLQGRDGLRLDGARQRQALLRRQRPGHPLGARRLDRGDQVEVRHGAQRSLVGEAQEHQLRRRIVVPTDLRRPGQPLHRRVQPGAVPRHEAVPVGLEPTRARTSTPTRS